MLQLILFYAKFVAIYAKAVTDSLPRRRFTGQKSLMHSSGIAYPDCF